MSKHKCPRVIRPNEYERQDKETFNWWCRLFDIMEHDYSIPPFRQKKVIEKIFPTKILNKILSLITLAEKKIPEDYRLVVPKSQALQRRSELSIASNLKLFSIGLDSEEAEEEQQASVEAEKRKISKTRFEIKEKAIDEQEEEKQEEEKIEEEIKSYTDSKYFSGTSWGSDEDELQQMKSEQIVKKVFIPKYKPKIVTRNEAGPNNPYVRFFAGKPERVAIWRDIPPLSLNEMNLNQRAEAITEAIAIDFVNWIKKIGGEQASSLDVPQVMKMFEIGFNTHAATSLTARVKEMPAVTKAIADARQLPQKEIRAKLLEKLREDLKAFRKKKKMFAFGTSLPYNMRYIPPKENVAAKWLQTSTVKRLEDMSAVWEGITDLRSTRGFCKWLIEHPEIPAPKYLENQGMLRLSFFDKPHYSIETQESVGSIIQHGSAGDIFTNQFK